jgi:hypothetical protein
MDKLIVFIIISCILSLIVPDAFATLYNDQQNNISIKYPAEWTFDNFSVLEDSKKDKIVYFNYYEEGIFPKADIDELWTYEGGDISDVKHAEMLVHNIDNPDTENDENYAVKLFDSQYTECLWSHSQNQGATCDELVLLESKNMKINGKDAHQIKYSWTEKYTYCDYSESISYPSCLEKEFENISIITDIINKDKVLRINSFFRSDMGNFLEMDVHNIINSLEFLEKKSNDLKIPAWIKNNAGWWSEGVIKDSTFIDGIQYMVDNLIITIPEQGNSNFLKVEPSQVYPPNHSRGISEVILSGKLKVERVGYDMILEITRPDGQVDILRSKITNGNYELIYNVGIDHPVGKYSIVGKYPIGNIEIGPSSFNLKQNNDKDSVLIPIWVKNNADWWSNDIISDEEFISTMQFLVGEGIIVLDKNKTEIHMVGNIESELLIYQSKLFTQKEPFSVLVIQATKNDVCSPQEKQNTKNYGQVTEYMLKKNLRDNPTEIIAVCMKLGDIKQSTYPLILKELEINRPNLIIAIGDIGANFESYYDFGAYGWWACLPVYDVGLTSFTTSCGINIIVVCECDGRYDDYHEGAIWTLSHEIAHYMLFEQNYSSAIFADNVHWVESQYQACRENDSKEIECVKLYESFSGYNQDYDIMDIQYLKSNRNNIQEQISQEIHSLK